MPTLVVRPRMPVWAWTALVVSVAALVLGTSLAVWSPDWVRAATIHEADGGGTPGGGGNGGDNDGGGMPSPSGGGTTQGSSGGLAPGPVGPTGGSGVPGSPGTAFPPYPPAYEFAFQKVIQTASFMQSLLEVLSQCGSPEGGVTTEDCIREVRAYFARVPVRVVPPGSGGCEGGWSSDGGGWFLRTCSADPTVSTRRTEMVDTVADCFVREACRKAYEERGDSTATFDSFSTVFLPSVASAGPTASSTTPTPTSGASPSPTSSSVPPAKSSAPVDSSRSETSHDKGGTG